MPRNLELKARDRTPIDMLQLALELGAADHGSLQQRDTYFRATRGRLELRQQAGEPALLIGYIRSGPVDARESRYEVAAVEDADATLAAPRATCGVLGSSLAYLADGPDHLDDVRDRGRFVELVAVGGNVSEFAHVRAGLRIADESLVQASYGPAAA